MSPITLTVPTCLLAKPKQDTSAITTKLLAADKARATDALLQLRYSLSLHTSTITTGRPTKD